MSYYLNTNNALARLRNDWYRHGSLIVAVDFDSTLVPYMEYEKTSSFEPIRSLVRDLKTWGCTIIIFTASAEDRHDDIKQQLVDMNIQWDLFNESPANIPNIGKTGKVYANAYLDDRAGLTEVYTNLRQLLLEKELELRTKQVGTLHTALEKYKNH